MGSGVDIAELAADVRPQDDLFGHVNGRWLARPRSRTTAAVYGSFHVLRRRSRAEPAGDRRGGRGLRRSRAGSALRKIGDLYAGFMDETAVDALGVTPIADLLAEVEGSVTGTPWSPLWAGCTGPGSAERSRCGSTPTPATPSATCSTSSRAGSACPTSPTTARTAFAEIRTKYRRTSTRMLELAGLADPAGRAERVIALETRLADGHWDRVTTRDAGRPTPCWTPKAWSRSSPASAGALWGQELGAGPEALAQIVVRQPSYLAAFAAALDEVPLEDWRDWLTWRLVHGPRRTSARRSWTRTSTSTAAP